MGMTDRIPDQLRVFLDLNSEGDSDALILWDTLKAFLRGCIKSSISYIKKTGRLKEEELGALCKAAENAYISDPSEANRLEWMQRGRKYMMYLQEKSDRRFFFIKQQAFEQGSKTGKLLAQVVRRNTMAPPIIRIQTEHGNVAEDPGGILTRFKEFYSDLYSSRHQYALSDLRSYLGEVAHPQLSPLDMGLLDEEITPEEVTAAIKGLNLGKSPGPDGIPLEVYAKYEDILGPQLRKMYVASLERGQLPDTLYDTSIVVLLKPDKNPLECGSYRPISLLNLDYKILTKIFANRLNKVIVSIVHVDQSGFIPGRSTSSNIRRAQVVAQVGCLDGRQWALASLDTAKTLDSIEWEFLLNVLECFGFGPTFVKWIRVLYHRPTANIMVNGSLSSTFPLHRGTQ